MIDRINLNAHIREFEGTRNEWLKILGKNPDSISAASHIVTINSKLELLRLMKMSSGENDATN